MRERSLYILVLSGLFALSFAEILQRFEYNCVDDGINPRRIDVTGYKNTEPILLSFAGHGDPAKCSATGNGTAEDPFVLSVTLNSATRIADCGVSAGNSENPDIYTVDIFTMSLDRTFRSNDRMYRIECDFAAGTVNTIVTAVPDITLNQGIDLTPTADNCQMSLRSGDGSAQLLQVVQFSADVILQTSCSLTAPGATGFRVTTCTAIGGTELSSPSVGLIKSNGCGDDVTDIIPSLEGFATRGDSSAEVQTPVFQMFAFRTEQSVLFTCKVHICYNNVDCSKSCTTTSKKRRAVDEAYETKEVLATVTLVPESSALVNPGGGGVTTDSCQDRIYLIMIIGLVLLLVVALLLFICFFAKLNKERRQEKVEKTTGEKTYNCFQN